MRCRTAWEDISPLSLRKRSHASITFFSCSGLDEAPGKPVGFIPGCRSEEHDSAGKQVPIPCRKANPVVPLWPARAHTACFVLKRRTVTHPDGRSIGPGERELALFLRS